MAKIRVKKIWGPSKADVTLRRVRWTFAVVFESGDVKGYALKFYLDTRKFSARPLTGKENAYAERMSEKDLFALPEIQRAEVITGSRITDILRVSLPPDQIALATAKALQYGR